MGYSILTDEDKIKVTMKSHLDQREKNKHWTVKLPCHGASIEVPKVQTDTYLSCPECSKKYLLTHSAVNNKLYGE